MGDSKQQPPEVAPLSKVDPDAEQWWTEKFKDAKFVTLRELMQVLEEDMNNNKLILQVEKNSIVFIVTHFIIADLDEDHSKYERLDKDILKVTKEQLALFLDRFGPWKDFKGVNILHHIWQDFFPTRKNCHLQPWFWGARADRDKEDKMFKEAQQGGFLVRFSSGNSLSLTYRGSQGVRTIHINKTGGNVYGFSCKSLGLEKSPGVTHLIATKEGKFKVPIYSPIYKLHEQLLDPKKASGYYTTKKTSEATGQ